MEVGKLNKMIDLENFTTSSDGMGSCTDVWRTEASQIWAAIWPYKAKEGFTDVAQTKMTVSHQIRIRYRIGVRPSWRVKFGNRYFNIESIINPEERNEWLDLMCMEIL